MHELPPLTCICHIIFISLGSLGDKFIEEQQKHAKIPSNPSLHEKSYLSEKNKFNYVVYI